MGAGAMGRGNHMGMPSTARFAAWLQWRHPEVRVTYRSFATPGSNSLSRVTGAGLDEVASARPDLLIWDYSSNDFSKHIFSSGGLRAVLEQLTRTVLSMPSRPTLLHVAAAVGNPATCEAMTVPEMRTDVFLTWHVEHTPILNI